MFKTQVETLFNRKIKSFQSDWGGEYRNYSKLFEKLGITHQVYCSHTHEQNGIIERKYCHIVETGLTLLAHAFLPLHFWDNAFLSAVYLINRMPTPILNNIFPLGKLFNKTPDYPSLKVFGCACYPLLRPYNNHKLQFRSQQYVFLGYNTNRKGYKCLHVSSGRIYISRHVIFDENLFPFASKGTQPPSVSCSSISLLSSPPVVDPCYPSIVTSFIDPLGSPSLPQASLCVHLPPLLANK